ncbi:MAG: TatD family hydrolase [Candidatus Thermoplasmatota archaeon]|nr:TatD family hydrolase [Candidatus Thermoplasmatota archaeon]
MDITDNHFHLDPLGHKEKAVKAFLNSGGTRLVLVHKPYSPWKRIDQFKEQVKTTLNLSKKARNEGAKVAVVSSPHPVQLVKLLDYYDSKKASEIYLEAVDFCTSLVEERRIVGLGELGRPHFEVGIETWNLSNSILEESLRRAKEVDASVILHTEEGTPEVMADLASIANKASFPKSRLVKHYGGIGSIENSHGITVSLLASNENIAFASKRNHSHMLETDYLDDPNRPGAVLGPKTVPRKTLKSLEEGVIDEEQFSKIHTDLPDFIYKEFI